MFIFLFYSMKIAAASCVTERLTRRQGVTSEVSPKRKIRNTDMTMRHRRWRKKAAGVSHRSNFRCYQSNLAPIGCIYCRTYRLFCRLWTHLATWPRNIFLALQEWLPLAVAWPRFVCHRSMDGPIFFECRHLWPRRWWRMRPAMISWSVRID